MNRFSPPTFRTSVAAPEDELSAARKLYKLGVVLIMSGVVAYSAGSNIVEGRSLLAPVGPVPSR